MKGIKKLLSVLVSGALAVSLAGAFAACDFSEETQGDFVDDGYIAALSGDETVVNMLYASAMGIGQGYADQLLPKYASTLTENRVENEFNGVAQYFVTREAYNQNVDENNIRLNFVDWGWDDNLFQKMTAAYAAWDNGNGTRSSVDVILGENQMRTYMLNGGLVQFPQELEDWVRENMLPTSYQDMTMADNDGDGKEEIYGCAVDAAPQVLIWNKNILRECGVDEDIVENGVETWDEWMEVCELIGSKRGYAPGGVYGGANLGGAMRAYPFIAQAGGSLRDSNGDPHFTDQGTVDAMTYIRQISEQNISEYYVGANTEVEYYTYFNNSRIAYVTAASYQIGSWVDAGNDIDNIGWCPLPVQNEGDEQTTNLICALYLAVPSWNQDKQDEAFKVIKSYLDEDVQTVIGQRDFKPVNNMKVAEQDWYKEQTQYFAYEIMRTGNIVYMPDFTTTEWECFNQALLQTVLYDSYGDRSIADILQAAENEANTAG